MQGDRIGTKTSPLSASHPSIMAAKKGPLHGHSIIRPIQTLPLEVLGGIFERFVADGGDPKILLFTSRDWNRAALLTSNIWRSIEVRTVPGQKTNIPALYALLRRTGATCPLEIGISVTNTRGANEVKEFLRVLISLGKRWRTLTICELVFEIDGYMEELLFEPLTNLTTLTFDPSMKGFSYNAYPLITHVARTSPLLVHLNYANYMYPPFILQPDLLARLRSVTAAQGSNRSFMHDKCINAERVTYIGSTKFESDPFCFPSARQLTIHHLGFGYFTKNHRDRLYFPIITHLHLHDCTINIYNSWGGTHTVTPHTLRNRRMDLPNLLLLSHIYGRPPR